MEKSDPNQKPLVSQSNSDEQLEYAQIQRKSKFLEGIRRLNEQTVKVEDVLQSVHKALRLDKKAEELSLLMLWPQVVSKVNPQAVSKSRALKITRYKGQKQLEVAVSEPALLSVLQFSTAQLVQELNRFSPQTGIELSGIRFVIRHHGDYQ